MYYPPFPALPLQSTEIVGQGTMTDSDPPDPDESQCWTTSIHILDDDSLLNIFYLYRPVYQGDEEIDEVSNWYWWYKLAQICGRWRGLILRSASFLGLCLVCTNGTPVADMLAHSPPFPLIINFIHGRSFKLYSRWDDWAHVNQNHPPTPHGWDMITAEDEERIVLALQQRNRVRNIHFRVPIRNLQRFIMAIDGEYSMLESLVMLPPTRDNSTNVTLPQTFRAPHLQRLVLSGFAFPTESPLRTTVISRLVTLCLYLTHPSAYFRPSILHQYLSSMPQLEKLVIGFFFPVPNRDVERQLLLTPIRTHVTLPSLRYFTFQGVGAYLEALVCGITTPRLEKLGIVFFNQLIYSLPHLLQFMRTTASLKFYKAKIEFSSAAVHVELYPRDGGGKWAFRMDVDCEDLDWQVSSVAEISDALSQAFFAVEHLALGVPVGRGSLSSDTQGGCYKVDCTAWHRLLSSFGNVKTLIVDSPLVAELSRCLLSEDEELPLGLLPELQQLIYSGDAHGDAFRPFIDSRRNASRPVTLIRQADSHWHPDPGRTILPPLTIAFPTSDPVDGYANRPGILNRQAYSHTGRTIPPPLTAAFPNSEQVEGNANHFETLNRQAYSHTGRTILPPLTIAFPTSEQVVEYANRPETLNRQAYSHIGRTIPPPPTAAFPNSEQVEGNANHLETLNRQAYSHTGRTTPPPLTVAFPNSEQVEGSANRPETLIRQAYSHTGRTILPPPTITFPKSEHVNLQ